MKSPSLPLSLGLLWLIGIALRLTILAVPPVLPTLRSELNLSGTEIGILTGLPITLFAAAALVGSQLVGRLGAVIATIAGLLLTALGSALRGATSDVIALFATTVVMGAGVAITQPAMPALVGRWLPNRIGVGTGIYTNGLLVGEILPIALFPLLFALFGHSWRSTFVFWAVPIVAIALVVMAAAPRDRGTGGSTPQRWWPNWPARDIWTLGLVFGSSSALYYASNAFLPSLLTEAGRPDLITPALTALNTGQLPASFILIGFAPKLERRAWPFMLAGVLSLASIAGLVASPGIVTIASAAVLGFAGGAVFALGLTLPPLLSASREVARVSAAMFTIGYASAVGVSVLSGVAWDFMGTPRYAFLPIALSALPLIVLVPTIRFDRKPGAGVESE